MYAVLAISCITIFAVFTEAVPPQVCFENFRWDDCGKEPVPVMYYWKPGSRCEVGIWRGCLPNLNMFKDEYECVTTCIFTVKAEPADFHNLNEIEELRDEYTEGTTICETDSSNTVNTNDNYATNSDINPTESASLSDDQSATDKTADGTGTVTEATAGENDINKDANDDSTKNTSSKDINSSDDSTTKAGDTDNSNGGATNAGGGNTNEASATTVAEGGDPSA